MGGRDNVIPFTIVAVFVFISSSFASPLTISKRSIIENVPANYDYADYTAREDEYPAVRVVPKRAALLLDRLMVALQKVVDNQGRGETGRRGRDLERTVARLPLAGGKPSMELERRGQVKNGGFVYRQCYFNPVTCFKKK